MERFPRIGSAEVWADRRDLPSAVGPEAEEAFRLLAEDISYFIDVPRSTVFIAKEHVIVDKKIIVPPLPKPSGQRTIRGILASGLSRSGAHSDSR